MLLSLQLIEAGANIEIQNKDGVTALMYSILWDKPDITTALVNKGADLTKKDIYNRNAVDYAKDIGRDSILAFLQSKAPN